MPFTLSHSAAVLPFLRSKRFSATALIIGTMAPDFEYFFRMNVQGIYGHTLLGILYFDIPVIVFLAFVFHGVVRENLIDSLPVYFQSRFQHVKRLDFKRYFLENPVTFVLSGALGTITHIVWDGFTHKRQFFVEALPFIYEGRSIHLMGADYPLWYALQYISTVVGGVILLVYVMRMPAEKGSFPRPSLLYWVILAAFIAGVLYLRMRVPIESQYYVVAAITSISAFCMGITILGLIPFRKDRRVVL